MMQFNLINLLSYLAMNFQDVHSMFQLGLIYHQGSIVECYPEEAAYWLKKVKKLSPNYYRENVDHILQELN